MKKNDNNFKNLDLQTIVDDPFAEESKKEAAKNTAKQTPKKVAVEEKVVQEKPVASNNSRKKAKAPEKKKDELSFDELTNYVNMLPTELFRGKLSTVQIPQEFVELIKQISYETGKPAFQIATAIIQMGLSKMKGDIKDMIDRKSKRKIDLI